MQDPIKRARHLYREEIEKSLRAFDNAAEKSELRFEETDPVKAAIVYDLHHNRRIQH